MSVRVLGNGARAHALGAPLFADRGAGEIICLPGNPGMPAIYPSADADRTDPAGLELPLSLGHGNSGGP